MKYSAPIDLFCPQGRFYSRRSVPALVQVECFLPASVVACWSILTAHNAAEGHPAHELHNSFFMERKRGCGGNRNPLNYLAPYRTNLGTTGKRRSLLSDIFAERCASGEHAADRVLHARVSPSRWSISLHSFHHASLSTLIHQPFSLFLRLYAAPRCMSIHRC